MRGRVFLAWQPIVESIAPRVVHFHEGLVRILDPLGQVIQANAFIELIEHDNIGRQLDCFSLSKTISILENSEFLTLSVNASVLSFLHKPWIDILMSALRLNSEIGSRLIIEITETSKIKHSALMRMLLDDLNTMGIRFAMDDYGRGHTSITNLLGLGFQYVKISKELVAEAMGNQSVATKIYGLVKIARSQKIYCIAEGIESNEISEQMRALGCFGQQGYHFGRPSFEINDDDSSLKAYRMRNLTASDYNLRDEFS